LTILAHGSYLPGIAIPVNVLAIRNLLEAVHHCTILVFVLPHQFVKKTCELLKGHLTPSAKALSLIKVCSSIPLRVLTSKIA
jgi:glycerol-3-phosphate dehydrogenase (NAD+)